MPGMVAAGDGEPLVSSREIKQGQCVYSGSLQIFPDSGDRLLRIKSRAMLAAITIGYVVKLVLEKNRDMTAERRKAMLQQYFDIKNRQINYLETAIRDAGRIREQVVVLMQRLIRTFPEEKFGVTEELLVKRPSKDDLHRLERLAQSIARNNQRIRMPTTIQFQGGKYVVEDENRITFQADDLLVKAADDFRLYLQQPTSPYRLSWKFEVKAKGSPSVDIGFSVLEQTPSGTLPQVVPYSRSRVSLEPCSILIDPKHTQDNTIVVLFDNSYSWLKEKRIR